MEILLNITFTILFISSFVGLLFIIAFTDKAKVKKQGGLINAHMNAGLGFKPNKFIDSIVEEKRIKQAKFLVRVVHISLLVGFTLLIIQAINRDL